MEGLFGLLVILYLIWSVVGAVLDKVRQGPVLSEPFPTQETTGQEEVTVFPLEGIPSPERPEFSGLPQGAEPEPDRAAEPEVTMPGPEPVLEPVMTQEGPEDFGWEDDWTEEDDWSEFDDRETLLPWEETRGRRQVQQQAAGGRVPLPATPSQWQRAFVLAEILAPPLSRRRYR
ncbi:MAG: hypothetical protein GX030_06855 [Firmicutes bacterium]|nr:hypothetical protein [Bacillota bacterium]